MTLRVPRKTCRAETESSRSQIGVRKVNLSYSPNRIVVRGLMVRVARRYQVTIPEEVREKAKISVGDDVDVRYEDGKILLEKLEDNWEKVMKETEGSWADHPVFGKMKNSVEIVHWLRSAPESVPEQESRPQGKPTLR